MTLFASFRVSKFTGSLRKTTSGAYQFEKLHGKKVEGGNKPKQTLSNALSIPIDILLSLLVGSSAALFLTDEVKMRNDLANIPLVEGRSLVSDELCPDFIKEYHSKPRNTLENSSKSDQMALRAIKTFVHNCEERDRLVTYRQKLLSMDRSDASNIPTPGVLHHLGSIDKDKADKW